MLTLENPASHGANSYTGAPQLNGDDSHSLDAAAPARTPTPEDHLEQADDWFKAGRFFSIWAHEDQEIHKKKFVLLDSMNKEGKGVLVESLDRDGLRRLQQSSSAYRTHVELRKSRPAVPPDMQPTATGPTPQPVGPSGISKAIYPSSYAEAAAHPRGKRSETPLVPEMKFKFAYMDEYVHRDVAPNTYILLEHTYNIPFFKYKCEDHGMLDDDSLQDLRQYYVDYLSHRWRLGSRQK